MGVDASRSTRMQPRLGKRWSLWTAHERKTCLKCLHKGLAELSTLSNGNTLHGLAFLTEEETEQELPEEVGSSLFSGDNSWSQHVRLLIRDVFGTDPPIFLNGCAK